MRHCSTRHRPATGFTLVELLVAISSLAVILSGLCGVFLVNQAEFDRQSGCSSALVATRTACDELGTYTENAMLAKVFTRYTPGDTLALCLPADTAYGVYVPISANDYKYRAGQTIVFYLSDTTGKYDRSGNILWKGTMISWRNPNAIDVTPDTAWSYLTSVAQGRITPISYINFTMPSSGVKYTTVSITVSAPYKAGSTTTSLTRNRKACLRNLDGY